MDQNQHEVVQVFDPPSPEMASADPLRHTGPMSDKYQYILLWGINMVIARMKQSERFYIKQAEFDKFKGEIKSSK